MNRYPPALVSQQKNNSLQGRCFCDKVVIRGEKWLWFLNNLGHNFQMKFISKSNFKLTFMYIQCLRVFPPRTFKFSFKCLYWRHLKDLEWVKFIVFEREKNRIAM